MTLNYETRTELTREAGTEKSAIASMSYDRALQQTLSPTTCRARQVGNYYMGLHGLKLRTAVVRVFRSLSCLRGHSAPGVPGMLWGPGATPQVYVQHAHAAPGPPSRALRPNLGNDLSSLQFSWQQFVRDGDA